MHAARAPASRFLGDDACDEQMLPCLAHSARRLLLRPVVCRALPPVLAVSVGTAIHSSFASQTLRKRFACGNRQSKTRFLTKLKSLWTILWRKLASPFQACVLTHAA